VSYGVGVGLALGEGVGDAVDSSAKALPAAVFTNRANSIA
jgi:hypothetical protein